MVRFVTRFCLILLPLFLLTWVVQERVLPLYEEGEAASCLGLALGAVVATAVWLTICLRLWVLPWFAKVAKNSIYGSGSVQDDPLTALATRMRAEKNTSLLPELLAAVEREDSRARAWSELAAVYEELLHDVPEAVRALLRGAERVSDKQERAMLIYRAAHLRDTRLQDKHGAHELYYQAAEKYPKTVYGKKAAERCTRR